MTRETGAVSSPTLSQLSENVLREEEWSWEREPRNVFQLSRTNTMYTTYRNKFSSRSQTKNAFQLFGNKQFRLSQFFPKIESRVRKISMLNWLMLSSFLLTSQIQCNRLSTQQSKFSSLRQNCQKLLGEFQSVIGHGYGWLMIFLMMKSINRK